MYAKIFEKMLDSSIWLESDSTVRVWVTLLLSMDSDGFCAFASIENLARRARVKPSLTEKAISILEAPDNNSASPDDDGRRIKRVQGGWMVLNGPKYRGITNHGDLRKSRQVSAPRNNSAQLGTPSDLSSNGINESLPEVDIDKEKNTSEDAWFVARGVSVSLRLAGQDIISILHDQAEYELKDGDTPENVGNRMIAAWKAYEKVKAEAKFGVKNFFAAGEWRKHKPVSVIPRKSASERMAEAT